MESSAVPEILENSFFAQCITLISKILKILNDVHFIAFYIIVLLLKRIKDRAFHTESMHLLDKCLYSFSTARK